MNLERILSHVLPAHILDLPDNCQKNLFEGCDAACSTGHLGTEPQPGKENLDPKEGTGKHPDSGTDKEN